MPAVALVLATSLACLQVAGEQLRLQDAAADTARSLGRGEPASTALLERAMPGASLEVQRQGHLVCAVASAPAAFGGGLLSALVVRASACSLDGGR